ncbi:TetR/AcrR family transcriptional regulator [Metabacillus arenae]|uniref:TetR/AcrR family transcriptional regulator n=1 Tax=Metabacillus arenae TaxID=2771434 RepID=A0A926NQR3_9BACI|nr:TetR/AcrR family transcriptional regulator [Metabacillus arenae]MBD1382287.1 TetR/AcrR family transcriptional regulator [Metabacillus arenae]
MNGFERRKQAKMKQIRIASLELFAHYGIQKVNIHEIAEKANVSQVTIYNYFGSKEALVVDVVRYLLEEQMDYYDALLAENISFEGKIKKIFEQKIYFANKYSTEFLQYLISQQGEIKELVETVNRTRSNPFFQKLVDLGKKEGFIRADLSFENVMFFFNMFMNEAAKHSEFMLNSEDINKKTTDMLNLFFYGLIGKEK